MSPTAPSGRKTALIMLAVLVLGFLIVTAVLINECSAPDEHGRRPPAAGREARRLSDADARDRRMLAPESQPPARS